MNTKPFGSWELYRYDRNGVLEFRKINSVLPDKSKNFLVLRRKNNNKTLDKRLKPVRARFEAMENEIYVYFDDSYKDVILKIKKIDDNILEVIDNTNGLGLR